MPYSVLVSKTFQREYRQLSHDLQKHVRSALKELQSDPYVSRPHCDIKALIDTKPKKYRLRVGDYRIIYVMEKKEVKVLHLLKREIGYSRLE